mmetsp:Transcript_162810/g.521911  ORF Transcript_162810/g.521911 Transcript_162810/m.521911 type:complete len:265 (-) Transcript_162810:906-1700(-)
MLSGSVEVDAHVHVSALTSAARGPRPAVTQAAQPLGLCAESLLVAGIQELYLLDCSQGLQRMVGHENRVDGVYVDQGVPARCCQSLQSCNGSVAAHMLNAHHSRTETFRTQALPNQVLPAVDVERQQIKHWWHTGRCEGALQVLQIHKALFQADLCIGLETVVPDHTAKAVPHTKVSSLAFSAVFSTELHDKSVLRDADLSEDRVQGTILPCLREDPIFSGSKIDRLHRSIDLFNSIWEFELISASFAISPTKLFTLACQVNYS